MNDSSPRWLDCAAVVAVCLPLYFVRNWEGTISGDALRYAAVAKNIVETGDWLILQEQPGVLYANKPPLMFWLIALAYHAFGVSIGAAKFWSATIATAAAVMVYLLARRLFDRHVGLIAGCMAATCIYAVKGYGTVRLESAVTLAVVCAAYAVVRAVQDDRPRWLIAVGVAAGLGTMVKPVAALHVFAVAVIAVGCLRRRWLANPWLLASPLVAGAILAPWHIAASVVGGEEFTRIYFGREIGERMTTGRHFFTGLLKNCEALLVGALPWTPLFLAALWPNRKRSVKISPEVALLCALWIAEVAIFMAWPTKRRDRYVLAAYPAIVLPAAWMLAQWLPEATRGKAPRWILGVAVAGSMALLVLPIDTHRWQKMEFVHGRAYVDVFAPEGHAAYYDPRYPTGLSDHDGQWSARAAFVVYVDRGMTTYQTVEELEAAQIPHVFSRDSHDEALIEAGWILTLSLDSHYRLYENPGLKTALGSDVYNERRAEVDRRIAEMGEKPIL